MSINYKQIARFRAIANAKKEKKLRIEANAKENKEALKSVLTYAQIDLENYFNSLPAESKDLKESVQISIDNIEATLDLLERYDLKLVEKQQTKQKEIQR